MKSIFWTQNSGVFEEDTLYIDELKADSFSKEEIIHARDFLYNFPKYAVFSSVQFETIIERYQLPQNFKYFYSKQYGSYLQGVFEEKDENGRHMPFIVWSDTNSTNGILNIFYEYANKCGKTLSSTNKVLYENAISEIRKGKKKPTRNIYKIIAFCLLGFALMFLLLYAINSVNIK